MGIVLAFVRGLPPKNLYFAHLDFSLTFPILSFLYGGEFLNMFLHCLMIKNLDSVVSACLFFYFLFSSFPYGMLSLFLTKEKARFRFLGLYSKSPYVLRILACIVLRQK